MNAQRKKIAAIVLAATDQIMKSSDIATGSAATAVLVALKTAIETGQDADLARIIGKWLQPPKQ